MITRRDFIKGLGAAVGALLMPQAKRSEAESTVSVDNPALMLRHGKSPLADNLGMVIDLGECVSFDKWTPPPIPHQEAQETLFGLPIKWVEMDDAPEGDIELADLRVWMGENGIGAAVPELDPDTREIARWRAV